MTIKQLTEIVNGSLTPSNQKLDADLIEISSTASNAIQVSEDGFLVDVSQLATKTELADAIAGIETGGGTTQPEWTLTNATLVNGVLTYTGGTFEDEGGTGTITGLFARKSLKVGESVTIDYALTMEAGALSFAVDEGIKVGSNSDNGALFYKAMNSVRLVKGHDWPDPYTAEEDLQYKATIQRVSTDRVTLTLKDQFDIVRAFLDVYLEGADLKSVWILVSGQEVYSTNVVSVQAESAPSFALDLKVDKEEGKGLSTNDYTTEDKEKIQAVRTYILRDGEGSASYTGQEENAGVITYTIQARSVENQMFKQSSETVNTDKVNSVPLYSLDNNGEYVLTEPDSWVSFNNSNYLFPVYHKSTIHTYYVKGIVTFGAVFVMDGETPIVKIDYSHNVSDVIDDYIIRFNPTLFFSTNAIVAHTFESSVEGVTKFGTIKIPLNLEQYGMTLQQYLEEQVVNKTTIRVEFALKVGSKETATERQYGIFEPNVT